jgi:hypothetical protein
LKALLESDQVVKLSRKHATKALAGKDDSALAVLLEKAKNLLQVLISGHARTGQIKAAVASGCFETRQSRQDYFHREAAAIENAKHVAIVGGTS